MPSSRALIVDRDKTFAPRLDRCLGALGFTVEIAENRREALESLALDTPGIIVIAVERPKKAGFKIFTDVKQLIRNVPIVLTTATVPMAELLMHQKLRLHADAYIDKRELTDRELLDRLNELLGLSFDPAELSRLAAPSRSGPARHGRSRLSRADAIRRTNEAPEFEPDDDLLDDEDGGRLQALDPGLADLLADVDASPVIVESTDADLADDLDEDDFEDADEAIASLQEEVRRLQRELDHAQRSASSSPFSTDYLDLTHRVDAGERSKARMRREVDTRVRQVESLRAKLLQIAGRLLSAERLRDQSLTRVRELEARLGPLESEQRLSREHGDDLARRLDEEQDRRTGLEQQNASTVESFEIRLADEKRRSVEAQQRHRLELTAAEQRHQTQRNDAVEHERRRLDEQLQQMKRESEATALARAESLRAEQEAAIEARDSRWQHKLDELQKRHELELKARQEERRKDVANMQGAMEQALLRKEREMQQASADAVAGQQLQERQAFDYEEKIAELQRELAQAMDAVEGERSHQIQALSQEHANDLEERDEEHRKHVDRLIESHHAALGESERRHEEAIEQALDEVRQEYVRDAAERLSEFELAEAKHRKDLVDAEQHYEDQIELVKKLHEEELDQLKARHERECERIRAEHDTTTADLESKILARQEQAAAAKQAEWQAEIESMRQEQAQALTAEREEMQVIIDALETVKGVDRSEAPDEDAGSEPNVTLDTAEQNSALLRQIAEEMDRIGQTATDSVDDTPDPEPATPV
jgi:CheY-like chemotaxis protein